jgi:kinesin family member 6/9
MTGGQYSYEDRGLIPRTLAFMFEETARRSDRVYSLRVSYLEVYNNDAYDLLRNEEQQKKRLEDLPKVVMTTDRNDEIHLKNIGTLPVNSIDEALNCLFIGETNRYRSRRASAGDLTGVSLTPTLFCYVQYDV